MQRILALPLLGLTAVTPLAGQELFRDDFESGLGRWQTSDVPGVSIIASGHAGYGNVLQLNPNGDVLALIRGSEAWNGVRVDGELQFPTNRDNYLGFLYNFQRNGDRLDYGNVYLKGNGSYFQANPHRDNVVSRTLYPEYSVSVTGADSVRIGEWIPFRMEVIGRECHIYLGSMDVPKIVFPEFEGERGALGFQPRSVGDPVWVDNVVVTRLSSFSWQGDPIPAVAYEPDSVITNWEVLGPFDRTRDDAARDVGDHPWRPFATDRRGAVVTGRVVDSHGPNTLAYFRTTFHSPSAGRAVLHLSTIDDLAIWVNNRFHWFVDRARRAWPDFWSNPDHAGQRIPIDVVEGENTIVIRVRGGVYATGGFFARIEEEGAGRGRGRSVVR